MKRPPREFFEQYHSFRERWDWARRSMEEGDVIQAKLIVGEMREYAERWKGRVGIPELENVLAQLRGMASRLESALLRKHLEDFVDLLTARRVWLLEQEIAKTSVAFLEIMKHAPAVMRPELEKVFRDHQGYDFDAERFFRQGESLLEEYEKSYRAKLAAMEINWPEYFATATKQRLDAANIQAIDKWTAELQAQQDEISASLEEPDAG